MRNNWWRQLALVMAMMALVSGLSLPVAADPYPGVAAGTFPDGGSHRLLGTESNHGHDSKSHLAAPVRVHGCDAEGADRHRHCLDA